MKPRSVLNASTGAYYGANWNGCSEAQKPGALNKNTSMDGLELADVWKLWDLALRLEMLCSSLEDPDRVRGLKKPEMSLLTSMKERGGQLGDNFMINLMEHQVTRVENCVSALQIRHLVKPLKMGIELAEQARPISEILAEVAAQLQKFRGGNKKSRIQEVEDSSEDDSDTGTVVA